jgi:hypothetical protein
VLSRHGRRMSSYLDVHQARHVAHRLFAAVSNTGRRLARTTASHPRVVAIRQLGVVDVDFGRTCTSSSRSSLREDLFTTVSVTAMEPVRRPCPSRGRAASARGHALRNRRRGGQRCFTFRNDDELRATVSLKPESFRGIALPRRVRRLRTICGSRSPTRPAGRRKLDKIWSVGITNRGAATSHACASRPQ